MMPEPEGSTRVEPASGELRNGSPSEETMENTPSQPQDTHAVDVDTELDRRRAAITRWRGTKTSTAHSESCRGSGWTHQRRQQVRTAE